MNKRALTEISDINRIMDLLGGNKKIAELTSRSQNAVSNWRKFDNFPADTFLVMTQALAEQGYSAPASLWRQAQPARPEGEQCGETV